MGIYHLTQEDVDFEVKFDLEFNGGISVDKWDYLRHIAIKLVQAEKIYAKLDWEGKLAIWLDDIDTYGECCQTEYEFYLDQGDYRKAWQHYMPNDISPAGYLELP